MADLDRFLAECKVPTMSHIRATSWCVHALYAFIFHTFHSLSDLLPACVVRHAAVHHLCKETVHEM